MLACLGAIAIFLFLDRKCTNLRTRVGQDLALLVDPSGPLCWLGCCAGICEALKGEATHFEFADCRSPDSTFGRIEEIQDGIHKEIRNNFSTESPNWF